MGMPTRSSVLGSLLAMAVAGCAGQLPPPQTRSVIIYSGQRIQAAPERMSEVEDWLRPQLQAIDMDPSFLIRVIQEDVAHYPWDALEIVGDTADVRIAATAPDAETPYEIYAFLRLMQDRGTLEEQLPESEGAGPYEVEEAIVSRVADVWLLGRSVYDTQPFGPMDEILYAKEFGFLKDFVLATEGDRFPAAAAEYRQANPDRSQEFREWFAQTFERDGPGYLRQAGPNGGGQPAPDGGGRNADDSDTTPS